MGVKARSMRLSLAGFGAFAALAPLPTNARPVPDPAAARWIAPPGDPSGVFDFRRMVMLTAPPMHWLVNVTADNRFQLYVNGQRVGEGPARGDLQHWRYETFDLGPYLRTGNNVVAARVWNFGDLAPSAQILLRTGFLLWSDRSAPATLDTGSRWQVRAESGWSYETKGPAITGPSEVLDGARYDWSWNRLDDRAEWSSPVQLTPPAFAPVPGPEPGWHLAPEASVRSQVPVLIGAWSHVARGIHLTRVDASFS